MTPRTLKGDGRYVVSRPDDVARFVEVMARHGYAVRDFDSVVARYNYCRQESGRVWPPFPDAHDDIVDMIMAGTW